ncbi:MAG: T9SS type A sorting domain-containing protein [Flavobacteriaceae bacterium]|nr:T9SS type A sorting domain-containing protein [Flavobacteriaceae bacterium]
MKKYFVFSLSVLFTSFLLAQPQVHLKSFATGLDKPVCIKHAGDERLFVIEQDGLIQIINSDGSQNSTPFLDIRTRVFDIFNIGEERGLLGLAFHPNYASNGYFYVNYTNNSGNTVVSRFSVSASKANIANSNSELILLTINQPFGNHNGGDLAFGPNGYLYISSGDGGSSGDPGDRAQNLNNLLGKLLRIDVDNTSSGANYAIPGDNPFVNNSSARDEIWAYGLRNAWKFSFDRQTNDLWIADVGQGSFEEINRASHTEAGLNYGWRCYEGNVAFNTSGCPAINTLTFPVFVYGHSGTSRCSITGGYRYRGTQFPEFSGLYFFADYCSNEIGMLTQNGSNWESTFTGAFNGNNWSAFGEDFNGELYIAGISSGIIYKLEDVSLSVNEFSNKTISIYPNPVKETFTIEIKNKIIKPLNVAIYDLNGRLIKKSYYGIKNRISISIANFNVGLYIVQVTDESGNYIHKKLVKI